MTYSLRNESIHPRRLLASLVMLCLAGISWASDGFPVTLEHKYGSITIPEPPQRVVSVGYSDQDDLLALGVTPVGVRDWYGDMPFATWPWAQDELGDAQPMVLGRGALDFEAIADLRPDLIIGISSGMSAEDYEKLSLIAPTLAQSGDYIQYGVPWHVRTRVIGRALGREAKADALVSRIQARIEAVYEEHPEFHDRTAAVAFYYDGNPGVYSSSDLRSRIMTQFGFRIPEAYDEMAGDSFYASFSEEELDLLDVDVLVWLDAGNALKSASGLKLRPMLDVYKEGREVFVGNVLGGAFSFLSPLSLDYLIDNLVPELALAVDGDPATPVPSASR